MFCSSKEPKEVFNLYLPSLQIQSFVAHSRRNNTRVSNHDQRGDKCLLVSSLQRKGLFTVTQFSRHCVTPARINTVNTTSALTWLDPGTCFKYFFFFDRKPKHEYYKPNNSAAAVTYKKNSIGKKKTTKNKEHVKEKKRNKTVFLKRPNEQRKQTTDMFENVCGQMCSPCWPCRSSRFCPSNYLQSSQ